VEGEKVGVKKVKEFTQVKEVKKGKTCFYIDAILLLKFFCLSYSTAQNQFCKNAK